MITPLKYRDEIRVAAKRLISDYIKSAGKCNVRIKQAVTGYICKLAAFRSRNIAKAFMC